MINFGYNNRWIRLVKDLLFFAVGVWLTSRASLLAVLVGIMAIFWYGRDAWFQAKVLWQEKHYKAPAENNTVRTAPKDDKITVTNPSGVKEVDFDKEA